MFSNKSIAKIERMFYNQIKSSAHTSWSLEVICAMEYKDLISDALADIDDEQVLRYIYIMIRTLNTQLDCNI